MPLITKMAGASLVIWADGPEYVRSVAGTRDVGTYIEEFLARCVLVLLHLQFSVCSSQTIVLFSKNQSENEANVSSLILRCAL